NFVVVFIRYNDKVPINDPKINIPEPGANDIPIDSSIEIVNNFDPTGGEPEIPPIEPDITTDPDVK
ncbi:9698_t:CDS:1, partial [Gigaspora rosea]